MKEKPFVSKHMRKTLHAFIEKEYGADTDAAYMQLRPHGTWEDPRGTDRGRYLLYRRLL